VIIISHLAKQKGMVSPENVAFIARFLVFFFFLSCGAEVNFEIAFVDSFQNKWKSHAIWSL
jgi:hypothetical protein